MMYIYIYIYICTVLYKRAADDYPLSSRIHFTKALPSFCVSKLEWLQVLPTSALRSAHLTRAALLILYFLMFGAKVMVGFILYFVFMAQQTQVGHGFFMITLTRHPFVFLQTSDRLDAETYTWQHTTLRTDIYTPGGILNSSPSKRAAADRNLKPHGHWNGRLDIIAFKIIWLLVLCMSSLSLARVECFNNFSYILVVTSCLEFCIGRLISCHPLFLSQVVCLCRLYSSECLIIFFLTSVYGIIGSVFVRCVGNCYMLHLL
jgi:hypothetical protein